MLQLSDKYINAARDAGLGNASGMYGHVKTLKKMGSADIPDGTSIETKGVKYKSGYEKKDDTKRDTATGSKAKIRQGVQGDTRGVRQNAKENKPEVHFNRFKGVVNTMDGAKDMTRKEETKLPPKSKRNPPQVVGLDTLDHKGSEAKERRAKNEKKATAAKEKTTSSAASGSAGGAGKNAEHSKQPQRAPATVRKLGKGSGNEGMSVQEKRAAFFEEKFGKKSS
eukprot:gb/GECG01006396.1/.p1 GENE.gb/GECG01006396.1/~~gb/GECG01006396.1/.p1  ORF type:complete len:224 (+),score=41.76 gb/GECG01006396.1/:1-672(+)